MTIRLVDTPEQFRELMLELAGAPLVAMDTEAASFHRYRDRVYLIQLSTPTMTAVVDPLTVGDLSPVGALLADSGTEKVFHDAAYDLRLFDKEFGFHARRLFDTRIAAQLLNEPGIGLGALLEKYFGLTPDKRFQRADWSARPLSEPMLEYAAGDTTSLCVLRSLLLDKLITAGREEWAAEEFEILEGIRWTAAADDAAVDYLHVKGARVLDRRGLAVLRELYQWRDQTAAELDRAPFRVMGNEVMLALAAHPVATAQELGQVKGIGRDTAERRGTEIVGAIARGLAIPDAELPRFPRGERRPADPAYEARLGALKLRRNEIAVRLDLAPGVLCPNGTLEAIARVVPADVAGLAAISELRRWQVREFGAELLDAIRQREPT